MYLILYIVFDILMFVSGIAACTASSLEEMIPKLELAILCLIVVNVLAIREKVGEV